MRLSHTIVAVSLVAGVVACVTAEVSANIVVNGSFENSSGLGQINAPNTTSLPGWRVAANSIDVVAFWQAADGVQSVDLTGVGLGRLEQDLPTTIGSLYEVRFAMAANTNGVPPGIFSLLLSAAGQQQQFDFNKTAVMTLSNMGYVEKVWQFTANTSSTTLAFASLTNVFNGGPVIDNVRVELVPAPATLGLAGIGGLIAGRRRRARNGRPGAL